MEGTLTFKIEATEQECIENLLNLKYSGVDDNHIMLFLSLLSLANSWHIDKLIYYINLLELENLK